MPERGQYPGEVGYYEGSPYEQPPRTSTGGVLGFHAARWMENRAETDIYREMSNLQGQMNESYKLMRVSQSPEEQQYHQENIVNIRGRYQELLNYAQTGASGIRASAAVGETPGLLGDWQGVKEGYPSGFNVRIPLQLTEPGQGAVPAGEGAPGWQPPAVATPGTPPPLPDVSTTPAAPATPTVDPYARIHGGQQPAVGTYEGAQFGGAPAEFLAGAERTAGKIFDYVGAPRLQQLFQGGIPEGAGDVAGQRIPYNPLTELRYQYGQMRPGEGLGDGTEGLGDGTIRTPAEEAAENRIAAFAPIDTPYREGRMRGFGSYEDLVRGTAGRDRGYGQFSRTEMGDIFEAERGYRVGYGSPVALRDYLDRETSGYSPYAGRDQIQEVDMGQGRQQYRVRRDAYGNVTSYTPA